MLADASRPAGLRGAIRPHSSRLRHNIDGSRDALAIGQLAPPARPALAPCREEPGKRRTRLVFARIGSLHQGPLRKGNGLLLITSLGFKAHARENRFLALSQYSSR
jgi:hypothetical protein